jgi:outer membrane receptor protein involved in Fe transport
VDANVSYQRRLRAFGRSVAWRLQLNVDNVLDNDEFVRMRVSPTGALQNYRFNDPREWILTSRFSF